MQNYGHDFFKFLSIMSLGSLLKFEVYYYYYLIKLLDLR